MGLLIFLQFFYLEVVQFEEFDFTTKEQLKRTAKHLYRTFIKEESDFEINIEGDMKDPIRQAIEACDQGCFELTKGHVYELLQPCYIQFTLSKSFLQMQEDLCTTQV